MTTSDRSDPLKDLRETGGALLIAGFVSLVAGILASKLGGTVMSYWVHPFRPRFSLKEVPALLRFSKWLLLNNLVNFLKERSTDFLIGRFFGPLRASVPLAAGIFEMSYWPFQIANFVSALVWSAVLLLFGDVLGKIALLEGALWTIGLTISTLVLGGMIGLLLAVLASLWLARRMVRPIRLLQAGAASIAIGILMITSKGAAGVTGSGFIVLASTLTAQIGRAHV